MSRLDVLVLYDDRAVGTGYVLEHASSMARHSRHRVRYLPATRRVANPEVIAQCDAVVIHFSVRLPFPESLDPALARAIARFRGPKIAMPQDEYDLPHVTARRFRSLGIDSAFTTVPQVWREAFYPPSLVRGIEFHECLTGYVGAIGVLERFGKPLHRRTTAIAYRGRRLPPWYGALGNEKTEIGLRMQAACERRGVPCDISVEESARITGDAWYRFLGASRATLATESGSNVVDAKGRIRAHCEWLMRRYPDMSRDEIYRRAVARHDGHVRMNQMAPKVFEAIQLGTGLVLYEGLWSGILVPDRHYIPLRKDWSNLDDVLDRVLDGTYLEDMTRHAYEDIVASGKYSYAGLVAAVDDAIDAIHARKRRAHATVAGSVLVVGSVSHAGANRSEPVGLPTRMPCLAPPAIPVPPVLSGKLRVIWLGIPWPVRKILIRWFGGAARRMRARLSSPRSNRSRDIAVQ